jgi:hypothetical protein
MHDPQNTPPQEETLNLTQDCFITQLTSADTPDESPLSSIFEGPGKEIEWSEWDDSHKDNANSDHGTIHEIMEEFDTTQNDPEQSFSTAPISIGPSAGPVSITLPSKVRLDKGKGHAQSTLVQEEGSPWHWNEREILPQMSMPSETWARLQDDLQNWSQFTEQGRAKAFQNQKDIIKLQERVNKSNQEALELAIAIQSLRKTVTNIETQARSQST